jgi:valyl-tRNA synthetase
MISGHVMASKGEKISKKKANSSMEPAELIDRFSADAVRLWTSSGSLGMDIVFSEEEFKNAGKLINKIWNVAKFVIMQLEGFDKTADDGGMSGAHTTVTLNPFDKDDKPELLFMDKWIISSFNDMLRRFENNLEKYEIGLAIGELEKFFWSYCDDYIEIIKNRVYKPEIYGENARKSGLYAAYHTLLGMIKCFAIYIPHVTEEIYQGYYAALEDAVSVHVSQIAPIVTDSFDSEHPLKNADTAVEIISQLRGWKSERKLSLKEELAKVEVTLPEGVSLPEDAIVDIKATCAVGDLAFTSGTELTVTVCEG